MMKSRFLRAGILLLISLVLAVVLEGLQIWSQPPVYLSEQDTPQEGEALDFSEAELTNATISGESLRTQGEGSVILFRFQTPKAVSCLTILAKLHIHNTFPIRVYCSADGASFPDSDMIEIEARPESLSWVAELPGNEYTAVKIETDGKATLRSISVQTAAPSGRATVPEPLRLWRIGIVWILLFCLLSVLRIFHVGRRLAFLIRRDAAYLRENRNKTGLRLLSFLLLSILGYTAVRWLVSGSLFGDVNIPQQLFCCSAGMAIGALPVFRTSLGAKPERLFVLFCLLTGCLMVFLFPNDTNVNWDSDYHYGQALRYSYLGENRTTLPDDNYLMTNDSGVDPYVWEERAELHAWQQKEYEAGASAGDDTGVMLNSVYEVFAGTGLFIGRVLHLSWNWQLYLGKLFNLLAYSACGYFAIRRLRSGKMILACVLLIPENVFLASTFSYDPGVTGFLALSLSWFFAEWQEPEKKLPWSHGLIILGSGAVACLTKAFYIPALLFTVFLPRTKWAEGRQENRRYMTRKQYLLLSLLVVLISLLPYLLPVFQGDISTDMRGGASPEPMEQIRYILADPLRWFRIMFDYQRGYFSPANSWGVLTFFAYQGTGPYWQVLYALLVFLAFTDKNESDRPLERKPLIRIVGLLLLYLVTCLICLCLYITFTDYGAEYISGVQPRYLLPLVYPVLMLAGSGFAAKLLKIDRDWKRQVFNGTAFLLSAAVLYCGIYSVCVSRF